VTRKVPITAAVFGELRARAVAHNEAVGDSAHKVGVGTLKKIFVRAWRDEDPARAMAKVDAFLAHALAKASRFDESKHNRDERGRFAPKAAGPSTPTARSRADGLRNPPLTPREHSDRQERDPTYYAHTVDVIPQRRFETTLPIVLGAATAIRGSIRGARGTFGQDAYDRALGYVARRVAQTLGRGTVNVPVAVAERTLRAAAAAANRRFGTSMRVPDISGRAERIADVVGRGAGRAAAYPFLALPKELGDHLRRHRKKYGPRAAAGRAFVLSLPAAYLSFEAGRLVGPILDAWFPHYVRKHEQVVNDVLAKGMRPDELMKVVGLARRITTAWRAGPKAPRDFGRWKAVAGPAALGTAAVAGAAAGAGLGAAAGEGARRAREYWRDEKGRFAPKGQGQIRQRRQDVAVGAAIGAGLGALAGAIAVRRGNITAARRLVDRLTRKGPELVTLARKKAEADFISRWTAEKAKRGVTVPAMQAKAGAHAVEVPAVKMKPRFARHEQPRTLHELAEQIAERAKEGWVKEWKTAAAAGPADWAKYQLGRLHQQVIGRKLPAAERQKLVEQADAALKKARAEIDRRVKAHAGRISALEDSLTRTQGQRETMSTLRAELRDFQRGLEGSRASLTADDLSEFVNRMQGLATRIDAKATIKMPKADTPSAVFDRLRAAAADLDKRAVDEVNRMDGALAQARASLDAARRGAAFDGPVENPFAKLLAAKRGKFQTGVHAKYLDPVPTPEQIASIEKQFVQHVLDRMPLQLRSGGATISAGEWIGRAGEAMQRTVQQSIEAHNAYLMSRLGPRARRVMSEVVGPTIAGAMPGAMRDFRLMREGLAGRMRGSILADMVSGSPQRMYAAFKQLGQKGWQGVKGAAHWAREHKARALVYAGVLKSMGIVGATEAGLVNLGGLRDALGHPLKTAQRMDIKADLINTNPADPKQGLFVTSYYDPMTKSRRVLEGVYVGPDGKSEHIALGSDLQLQIERANRDRGRHRGDGGGGQQNIEGLGDDVGRIRKAAHEARQNQKVKQLRLPEDLFPNMAPVRFNDDPGAYGSERARLEQAIEKDIQKAVQAKAWQSDPKQFYGVLNRIMNNVGSDLLTAKNKADLFLRALGGRDRFIRNGEVDTDRLIETVRQVKAPINQQQTAELAGAVAMVGRAYRMDAADLAKVYQTFAARQGSRASPSPAHGEVYTLGREQLVDRLVQRYQQTHGMGRETAERNAEDTVQTRENALAAGRDWARMSEQERLRALEAGLRLGKAEALRIALAKSWNEAAVRRHAKGTPEGGRFAPRGAGGRSYFEPVRFGGAVGQVAGGLAGYEIANRMLSGSPRGSAAWGAPARAAGRAGKVLRFGGTIAAAILGSVGAQAVAERTAQAAYRKFGLQPPRPWDPPSRPLSEEGARIGGSIAGFLAGSRLPISPSPVINTILGGTAGVLAGEQAGALLHSAWRRYLGPPR
jgi:hypothetical protein